MTQDCGAAMKIKIRIGKVKIFAALKEMAREILYPTKERAMPDRDVKTIRDLIWYQYAKIIAKSAMGEDAKKSAYGFVKQTFRDLKTDKKTWSDILREDKQFAQSEKECIYCGSEENQWEHIVPKTIKINERCPDCSRVQEIHNQVWACRECNGAKKQKGLYAFWAERHPGDKKFYDRIPPLLEKKYLKTIYYCHECNGSLDATGPGGVQPTVFDLDKCIVLE